MRPLATRSEDIFRGICGLFDAYVLHAFLFVSDMSLESLVWDEVSELIFCLPAIERIFDW